MSSEDPDIEIIKARKLKELREKAAALEKKAGQQPPKKRSAATGPTQGIDLAMA